MCVGDKSINSSKEEEELRVQEPNVNEVSFCARPHHNVHHTLGVDTGTTSPL
jgi:hypothetical protein